MSKQNFNTKESTLEKTYKVMNNKIHPTFGEIIIWVNSANRKSIFSKEIVLNDKKEASEMNEQIQILTKFKHENLLSILDYKLEIKSKFCSERIVFNIFFPFLRENLKVEI